MVNQYQNYTANRMIVALVLTLLATAYANVTFDSKCPDFKPVQNFNFSAYGTGVWQDVARYPNDYEEDITCDRGVYTLKGDYSLTNTVIVKNNKIFMMELIIKQAPDAGNTGKLIATVFQNGVKKENIYYILDTDYDNYAIVYKCDYNEEKKTRTDYAWVHSRTKILSSDIAAKVEKFMTESKYLHYDKLIWFKTTCNV